MKDFGGNKFILESSLIQFHLETHLVPKMQSHTGHVKVKLCFNDSTCKQNLFHSSRRFVDLSFFTDNFYFHVSRTQVSFYGIYTQIKQWRVSWG